MKAVICGLLLCMACRSTQQEPVVGIFAGQAVQTRVDSSLAACYFQADDPASKVGRTSVAAALTHPAPNPTDRAAYADLARRYSPDFATLRFASAVDARPENRGARANFEEKLQRLRNGDRPARSLCARRLLVLVPGFAYRADPATGADLSAQRTALQEIGCDTHFLEVDEIGTVESNATYIARELTRLIAARQDAYDNMILVSVSKGGAEVALALAMLDSAAAARVHAWVNVGGILRGTHLADHARVWPRSWLARGVFWFLGFPGELLSNLSTATRRPVFEALRIPAHIRRLNYLAAPLSGALQESVRGRYAELAPLGPNDGVTLLSDAFQREGVTIVELQLDHYFKDSDIHFKTQALAWLVLEVAIEENSNKFSPPWPPSIRNQDQGREYAN